MKRLVSGMVAIAILTSIILAPMQAQTLSVEGEEPVYETQVGIFAIIRFLIQVEEILSTLDALDRDQFFSEQCVASVCVSLPDFTKPGWRNAANLVCEASDLIQEFIDANPGLPSAVLDTLQFVANTARDLCNTLNDILDFIETLRETEGEDVLLPQTIVDDAINAFNALLNFGNQLIQVREALNPFNVAENGQPIIRYLDGAEWVNVYIGTRDFSATSYYEWTELSCTGDSCTFLPPAAVVNGDNYVLYLQVWSSADGLSDWISFDFTLNLPAPDADAITFVEAVANADGSVTVRFKPAPNMTWGHIWFGSADYTSTLYLDWHSMGLLDCYQTGATCEIVVPNVPAGSYELWLEGWGPGGYATGATEGNWQKVGEFSK